MSKLRLDSDRRGSATVPVLKVMHVFALTCPVVMHVLYMYCDTADYSETKEDRRALSP